jgi:hypothetical protein
MNQQTNEHPFTTHPSKITKINSNHSNQRLFFPIFAPLKISGEKD